MKDCDIVKWLSDWWKENKCPICGCEKCGGMTLSISCENYKEKDVCEMTVNV